MTRKGFAKTLFMLAAFAAIGACATHGVEKAATTEFAFSVRENVSSSRFELELTSTSGAAICLPSESWPNDQGKLMVDVPGVVLSVGDQEFAAKGTLFSAYCPGGCGVVRVDPGETVQGFLDFSVFGDPEMISGAESRRLIYPISPYRCR